MSRRQHRRVEAAALEPRPGARVALALLFIGSGCAALMYEVVWFQLLQLVIGSSAVSMGVLLATFMGGTCLGSLLLPRYLPRRYAALEVYAALEIGIAVCAVLVLLAMPLVGRVYVGSVGYGLPGFLLRGLVCALCLLPPTILMGATLPAVARWVEATPSGMAWVGVFYTANLAGAVAGCLAAAFYFLRVFDASVATAAAVALNLAVAAMAFVLARRVESHIPPPDAARLPTGVAWRPAAIHVAIGVSGLCALASQVIWTRLLSLLLGATVYTFAIVLAVFLLALGIGSSAGAAIGRARFPARAALGVCQLLLVPAIAWTAFALSSALPYWPILPTLSPSVAVTFQIDLVRCVFAIAPPALLWGASFPLALAAVASPGADPARLVGRVYGANTIGAIVGATAGSLVFISWFGTQDAQRILLLLSAAGGIMLLRPYARGTHRATRGLVLAGAAAAALVTAAAIAAPPPMLAAYGRYMVTWLNRVDVIYVGEGINTTVAVSRFPDGVRNFHVAGKVEASSQPQDMRLQRMLGHLPALLHDNPASVLVVGLGAGVTAGSFVQYPSVTRIVVSEIEPLIPQVIAGYFREENNDVVRDPRVQIVYDDARHFILTTRESFDVITSDPIHPWVKGSATLYTREYFDLVKRRLKPGGIVTQWLPLYESEADAAKMVIATFFEAFPDGTIWANAQGPGAIDVVLMGRATPATVDVDRVHARMTSRTLAAAAASLGEVGFPSAADLLGTYAGRAADLTAWLSGVEINRDRNLRLQYLAGLELNSYLSEQIYREILSRSTYPDALFVASPEQTQALKEALARAATARSRRPRS